MNRSLQSRLLVGLLIGCAALLAAGSVLLYVTQRKVLYQEFDRDLYRASRAFLSRRMSRSSRSPRTQPALKLPEGIDAFQVSREEAIEHSSRSHSGRDRPTTRPAPQDPEQRKWSPAKVISAGPVDWKDVVALPAEPKDGPIYFDLTLPDGRPGRAQAIRMTVPGPPIRSSGSSGRGSGPGGRGSGGRHSWRNMTRRWWRLTTVTAACTDELQASLTRLAWIIAAVALGAMAALGLLAVAVVRISLRPLRPLAQEIASLGRDNLGRSVSRRGLPAEIVPVVERLNGLLTRLDDAFQREQAFTANVAHELRTPLAGIRSTAEIALRRPRSSEEYEQALSRTLDVAVGLQDLVEKLLHVGRIDAGQVVPQLQQRMLRAEIDRRWQSLCEEADLRGLTFQNSVEGDLACEADPLLLETILANVLANAVQYADEGGTISAAASNGQDRLRLTVTNPASDLTDQDVEKVLDRFWRKDSARSATGVHFGLGLSLVQRCAAVHGGSVSVEMTAEKEFAIHVEFPIGQAPARTDTPTNAD